MTTRDMLGEYSLQAGDEEENAESFVTTQHSGSRTLQGKKPAVSHYICYTVEKHPRISHQLDPVPSGQCLEVSSASLPATGYGRREQTHSISNFLLICKLLKKFSCKLDRRRLTYRNLCFQTIPQCLELWAGVLNI